MVLDLIVSNDPHEMSPIDLEPVFELFAMMGMAWLKIHRTSMSVTVELWMASHKLVDSHRMGGDTRFVSLELAEWCHLQSKGPIRPRHLH